jgi:hypothetical protein
MDFIMDGYNGDYDPDLHADRRNEIDTERGPSGAGIIVSAVVGAAIWTLIEIVALAVWHWLRAT